MVAEVLIERDVALLAHQVDGGFAPLLHLFDEGAHQRAGVAAALVLGVDGDRHDDNVGRGRVMADQFLEGVIGHAHFVGAAAVDVADHFPVFFHDQKAFGILLDAGGDLGQAGGFVAFVGGDFDLAAAGSVGRGGEAKMQFWHVVGSKRQGLFGP